MKKVVAGIFIFVFSAILSFLMHFPTESLIRYSLHQVEKQSGLEINYSDGIFNLGDVTLNNVQVNSRNQRLFQFEKVNAQFRPGKMDLKAFKEKGTVTANVTSRRVKGNFNNFKLITQGTKFFKQVTVESGNFSYRPRQKSGKAELLLDLKKPLDPWVNTDIQADCKANLKNRQMTLSIVRIIGRQVSGNGVVVVTVNDKNFENSIISGTLQLNTNGQKVTIRISGTVKEPKAAPRIGRISRRGRSSI